MFETYRSALPHSAHDDDGTLVIGGVRVDELAETYGTPLYVYDEAHVEERFREYVDAFGQYEAGVDIAYACKAFCTTPMLALAARAGVGADVASAGELAIALAGGMPPERIVVHGNNKSRDELQAAVEARVGLVVLDAPQELDALEQVARDAGVAQPVLVRINPGIEVETHHYIKTAHAGSKFGVDPDSALEMLVRASESQWLEPRGLHVHLGSQLLDLAPWRMVTEWLAMYARRMFARGVGLQVVDLGGGLGIAYTEHQRPPTIAQLAAEVTRAVRSAWETVGLPLPRLLLEPGRSVVGGACVTLYRVGVVKPAGSITYVNVDGGMSDNIRPSLYQAEYRCLLATRLGEPAASEYWIAGKHCESGDVLIEDAPLPEPRTGDLLAVLGTGAYAHSMASNYNALPRPAVVFVADGEHRLAVRRETLDDLVARDVMATPPIG